MAENQEEEEEEEARESIRALIRASVNPDLSEEQCRILVSEAVENSRIAFGAYASKELTQITAQEAIEIFTSVLAHMETCLEPKIDLNE